MSAKWLVLVGIVAVILCAWFWLTTKKRANDGAPQGIVILLRSPRSLGVEELAQLLTQASGAEVKAIPLKEGAEKRHPDDTLVGNMVVGRSPHFLATVGNTAFAIHNLPSPYMNDPARVSETFEDLRLQKAIRDHKAWLSIDIVHSKVDAEAYRIVARTLARLVDADCLALYHPPMNRFVPCHEAETVTALNGDDPIGAVFGEPTQVPVVPIDDDPRLRAAEAEARKRFPEFEKAFREQSGEEFAVKTLVTAGGNSEHIWVEVDRIEEGMIKGRLGNDPVDLAGLKLGSPVEFKRETVEDWTYVRNKASVGLFTVPVIQKIQQERSRQK